MRAGAVVTRRSKKSKASCVIETSINVLFCENIIHTPNRSQYRLVITQIAYGRARETLAGGRVALRLICRLQLLLRTQFFGIQ